MSVKSFLRPATVAALVSPVFFSVAVAQQQPCIGNSAPTTGPAAFAGTALKMGAEIAIDEINAKGGILGKPLRFVQYDDAGAPPRGVDNLRRIALADKCIAILGGYHSTVALAMTPAVNEIKIPYVGAFAAITAAVENGSKPNYMFRVSANDKWVSEYIAANALKMSKNGKVAMFYENTGWGNANMPLVKAEIEKAGKQLVAAETFNWGDQDMTPQAIRVRDSGADTIVLYSLDREGNQILRSMDKVGYKPQVIGAWGLAGNLGELAGSLADGVRVSQTYTFMGTMDVKKQAFYEKLKAKFGVKEPTDIKVPSAVANAYDAVHIIADAIEKAGAYDWGKVHDALYSVRREGIIADYKPAFSAEPERHDAILPKYYKMTVWKDGKLLPIEQTEYATSN